MWKLETYIQDAEKAGGNELADWFRQIQENNRKTGDQDKKMLAQRLQQRAG